MNPLCRNKNNDANEIAIVCGKCVLEQVQLTWQIQLKVIHVGNLKDNINKINEFHSLETLSFNVVMYATKVREPSRRAIFTIHILD
jgi:hypothetical protein